MLLPKQIKKVQVPPLKIQGIKTKLVPFIASNISWDGNGTWYEPFMGSGVVGFNIQPQNAIFSDSNPHIINLYKEIQSGSLNGNIVRNYLEHESPKLAATPADKTSYYYKVRDRFNKQPNSLDFLFLQRSNFNGMIRFSKNGYNVPFGRKPERFAPALITKIVNQVDAVANIMKNKNWAFEHNTWEEALIDVGQNDFIYLDPPYVGRNAEYFNPWTDSDANNLAKVIQAKPGGYALSMWYQNRFRKNDYLEQWNASMVTNEHFYFLGGVETNRNSMTEALMIKDGYQAINQNKKTYDSKTTITNQ